jgi:predicted component of type VI protein secretion system
MRHALFATFIALALAGCASLQGAEVTPAPARLQLNAVHVDDQNPDLGCGAGAEGSCPPWMEWPR